MELMQLRYFVAVADAQSFTEAARRLHVSQPALSYQIKRLENELGARLFDRTSRHVSLTVDGRTFLPLAQGVLAKVAEALQIMEERLGVVTGDVALGVIPSVGSSVVPALLASFGRNFPGIVVRLVEAGSQELEREVLDGTIDCAIVTVPVTPAALEISPLMTEELLLTVPPGHDLARRSSVRLAELEEESFIVLGGSFTLSTYVLDACRRAGFEPRVAYEAGGLEMIKGLVRHELGIAILPRLALLGPGDDSLVGISFDEPLTRELNVVRAKDRYSTVATRALIVHVRTTMLSSFSSVGKPVPLR